MPQILEIEREIVRRYMPAVKPAAKPIDEPKSTEARDAAYGAVGGMIIGGLFGVAVLSTMGWAGIPADIKSRILEPFFTTKGQTGTGLGLSIVYAFTQRHGGHLDIESEPSEGARFRMWFPSIP